MESISNSKGKAKGRGWKINDRLDDVHTYWKPFRFSTSLGFPSTPFSLPFFPLSFFFFHFRLDPDDGDVVNWISSTRGKLNLREASYILSTLSLRRQNSAIHRTGTPWTRGDNTTTIRWVWMRAPLHPICIINLGKRLSRHLSLTCG